MDYYVTIDPGIAAGITLDVSTTVSSLTLGQNNSLGSFTTHNLVVGGDVINNSGKLDLETGSTATVGAITGSGSAAIYLSDHGTALHVMGDLVSGDGTGGGSVMLRGGAGLTADGVFHQAGSVLDMADATTDFQSAGFTQNAASGLRMTNTALAIVSGLFTNNGGSINLQSGSTLTINGDLQQAAGSGIHLTDGGTLLSVSGNLTNGGAQLNNRAKLLVGGSYSQSGAALTLDGLYTEFQSGSFTQDATSAVAMTNTSTATVNGNFTNNGGSIKLQSGSTLTINGNLQQTAGSSIWLTDGPTLLSVSGDLTNGGAQLTNGARLTVGGSYSQSAALTLDGLNTAFRSGNFTQDASSAVAMTNMSTAVVNGTFTNNGGAIKLQSGSTLTISGDLLQTPGSGISLTNGPTLLSVGGNLTNGGAQLTNSARLTVGGSYSQTGNTLSVDGIGTSFRSGSFTQDASAVKMSNTATATVNGTFTNNAGAIKLQSGATLAITGDLLQSGGSGISLTDWNTLLSVGGNLTNGGAQLNNSARLTVGGSYSQTGNNLTLDGIGTSFQSGSFTQTAASVSMSNQATAIVNGSFTNNGGDLKLQSGATLTIHGDLLQTAGSGFSLTDWNTLLSVGGDMTHGGGQMTNSATLSIGGTYSQSANTLSMDGVGTTFLSGGFTQDANSLLRMTNSATMNVNGPFLNNASTVTLQSSSLVTVDGPTTNNGTIFLDVSGAWVNRGDVTNNGELYLSGSFDAGSNQFLQNQGTTTVNQGITLTAATVTIDGGRLTGSGTIAGSLVNNASDDPGGLDPQTILGDYTQTPGGLLTLELGENGRFSSLQIGGNVTLSGQLDIVLYTGFDMHLGDRFAILRFADGVLTSGTNFSSYSFPIWNGMTFQEFVYPHEIDLVSVDVADTAVPEPSTFLLLFCALALGATKKAKHLTARYLLR